MVKAFLGREGIQVYSSEGPYPFQGETKIKLSVSVKIVLLNIVTIQRSNAQVIHIGIFFILHDKDTEIWNCIWFLTVGWGGGNGSAIGLN